MVDRDLFLPELTKTPPSIKKILGDARRINLADKSVDLIVTSPPYWKKRDYKLKGQIGQEGTPSEYVFSIVEALREWRRILRPTGSIFLNIGDTYHRKSLACIPGRIEMACREDGWIVRNRIVWAKDGGMPDPAKNRLANRHECILHLIVHHNYYYDLFGYSQLFGNGANPGDIWHIRVTRKLSSHLAPFPGELVERAITLACPSEVCSNCLAPRRRMIQRTAELDPSRPQARRAMEIAREAGLAPDHIKAIQATGISDAGKALQFQNGTGKNSAIIKRLAAEAKKALGGYFREFTFAKWDSIGWTKCSCEQEFNPGVVLDPFMGTGTTLDIALKMGRSAVGIDLDPKCVSISTH